MGASQDSLNHANFANGASGIEVSDLTNSFFRCTWRRVLCRVRHALQTGKFPSRFDERTLRNLTIIRSFFYGSQARRLAIINGHVVRNGHVGQQSLDLVPRERPQRDDLQPMTRDIIQPTSFDATHSESFRARIFVRASAMGPFRVLDQVLFVSFRSHLNRPSVKKVPGDLFRQGATMATFVIVVVHRANSFVRVSAITSVSHVTKLTSAVFGHRRSKNSFGNQAKFHFIYRNVINVLTMSTFAGAPRINGNFRLTYHSFRSSDHAQYDISLFRRIRRQLLNCVLSVSISHHTSVRSFRQVSLCSVHPSSARAACKVRTNCTIRRDVMLRFRAILSLYRSYFEVSVTRHITSHAKNRYPRQLLPFSRLPHMRTTLRPSRARRQRFLCFLRIKVKGFAIAGKRLTTFLLRAVRRMVLVSSEHPIFRFTKGMGEGKISPIVFAFRGHVRTIPLLNQVNVTIYIRVSVRVGTERANHRRLTIKEVSVSATKVSRTIQALLTLNRLRPDLPFRGDHVRNARRSTCYCRSRRRRSGRMARWGPIALEDLFF